jgi:uncharacterized cupredoxin-like copper-binding protein
VYGGSIPPRASNRLIGWAQDLSAAVDDLAATLGRRLSALGWCHSLDGAGFAYPMTPQVMKGPFMFPPLNPVALRKALSAVAILVAISLGLPGRAAAHDESMEGMAGMHHEDSPAGHHVHDGGHFAFGRPGRASDVDRTVTITMGDMSFTPARLQVKAGQTIRFVIRNPSPADHDFTLGDGATQAAHRSEMAKMAEAGQPMHHHHDGNAISVPAGKTGTLVWKFAGPGQLEYDCNLPGHFEAGMTGTLTVAP